MILRRALCVGVLAFSAPAMARQDATQAPRKTSPGQSLIDKQPARPLAEPALGEPEMVRPDGLLAPTRPRKQPFVNRIPADHTGAIIFKCIDESDARALPDGTIASLSNRDIADVQAIIAKYGLTCRRAINHSDEALAALEARAVAYSGKAQPKLATMMYLEGGDAATLLRALEELKASGNIDWAEWETKRYPAGGLNGACCLPTECLDNMTQAFCSLLGGFWNGPGSTCASVECPGACCVAETGQCLDFIPRARCEAPPPQGLGGVFQGQFVQCAAIDCGFVGACCFGTGECADGLTLQECLAQENGFWAGPNVLCDDPDGEMLDCNVMCGHPLAGDCFLLDGNGTPFCELDVCCGFVCASDPFCCDEDFGEWDEFCAASANLNCDNPGADTCSSAINEGCFEAHSTPGCNVESCCNIVCLIDPFCCQLGLEWDEGCVALALEACLADPAAPLNPRSETPLFVPIQGYRTPQGYDAADIPEDLLPFTPLVAGLIPVIGYGGAGWFLMEREPFTDENGNGVFDCGEPFADWNGNGVYDHGGEPFVDGETFTDLNDNGSWDSGEPFVDDNPANGAFDAPNCHYNLLSPFAGGAEQFTDQNFNGVYDAGDPYAGVYGLGQQLLEVFGVDNFGEGNLTLGKTIKTAVIEWAYWAAEPFTDTNGNGQYDLGEPFIDAVTNGLRDAGHEDLDVILEAGQTLFQEPEITDPDHGTATLSIINARADGKGITGIAPEAQGYFFPLSSVEEGPRELTAWTSALLTLGPGDVISASYGPGPLIGNLNNSAASWTMIRLAADLGITCCIAAGNACFNLDDAPDLGDSGGMVVGACSPGFPYYRLLFSNYCTAPDLARSNIVHVKAWGTRVASAGYGSMFNGNPFDLDGDGLFGEDPIDGIDNDGDLAVDEDPPPLPQLRVSRRYRADFGGTSAAAPQIAGLVACLQGLAKQFYGIPLMPEQIRGALGAPGIPPVNPPRLFGGFPEPGCALDFDPTLGPNMIGPYPVAAGDFGSAASTILNQSGAGFDDAPLITGIKILRGRLIFGNHFSIKGSDNNYLVIAGVPTVPTSPPQVPSESGVNPSYGFGLVTDVEVTAHAEVSFTDAIAVAVESHTTSDQALMFVELFDWKSRRWTFTGFSIPVVVDTTVVATVLGDPSRFIRKSDKKVLIRVWTIALGNSGGGLGGGGSVRHIMHHDLIDLTVGQDFEIDPPSF